MLMVLGMIQQAGEVFAEETDDCLEFGIRDHTVTGKVSLDHEPAGRHVLGRAICSGSRLDVHLRFPIRFWPPLEHAGMMTELMAQRVPMTEGKAIGVVG